MSGSSKPSQRRESDEPGSIFKNIREERKWFKNVRIYLTDLSMAEKILQHQKRPQLLRASVKASKATPGDSEPQGSSSSATVCPLQNASDSMRTTNTQLWSCLMSMLCKEIGIQGLPETFSQDDPLYGLGIDSLYALSISGRFRRETGFHLCSSAFFEYPTLIELQTFLQDEWNMERQEVFPAHDLDS